jgi:hypothetical protein
MVEREALEALPMAATEAWEATEVLEVKQETGVMAVRVMEETVSDYLMLALAARQMVEMVEILLVVMEVRLTEAMVARAAMEVRPMVEMAAKAGARPL